MPRVSASTVPPADLRAFAVAACCDPRTVRRYLDGGVVIPSLAAAIERVLREANRADLIRAQGAA